MDPDFPHDASSIVDPERPSLDLGATERWMRARMLGDPGEALLFDKVGIEAGGTLLADSKGTEGRVGLFEVGFLCAG